MKRRTRDVTWTKKEGDKMESASVNWPRGEGHGGTMETKWTER